MTAGDRLPGVSLPGVSLYVLDTGPLITLAAAGSLDYLLYPHVPVIIPDAVFYEATRDIGRLGAQSIVDWVKAHHGVVEIAVTNAYANFDAARQVNPRAYAPDLGEQAAVEVIEEPDRLGVGERAILLCEETAATRRIIVRERDKIIELTTLDFLTLLEQERRIQSAQAIFDRAIAAGRTPSRAEKFADHDPAIRDAVRETLSSSARGRHAVPRK